MADGKSNLGGYEPFNEAHAIYSCALSLTFAPSPDRGARWPALLSIAQKTGRELNLGVPTPAYGLSLTFDLQRVSISLNRPSPAGGESVGIEFATMDENGRVLDRFIASEDSLVVQTYAYIRWLPLFKRATTFFERMFAECSWLWCRKRPAPVRSADRERNRRDTERGPSGYRSSS